LRELRIDLVIVTAPEIGSTAIDSLLLNLLSIFAEFEREMIAKRIADARAALKRQGRRVGGALPLGYDADPLTKQLVANPKGGKDLLIDHRRLTNATASQACVAKLRHFGFPFGSAFPGSAPMRQKKTFRVLRHRHVFCCFMP
jgi:site-specific DNA recombinase